MKLKFHFSIFKMFLGIFISKLSLKQKIIFFLQGLFIRFILILAIWDKNKINYKETGQFCSALIDQIIDSMQRQLVHFRIFDRFTVTSFLEDKGKNLKVTMAYPAYKVTRQKRLDMLMNLLNDAVNICSLDYKKEYNEYVRKHYSQANRH